MKDYRFFYSWKKTFAFRNENSLPREFTHFESCLFRGFHDFFKRASVFCQSSSDLRSRQETSSLNRLTAFLCICTYYLSGISTNIYIRKSKSEMLIHKKFHAETLFEKKTTTTKNEYLMLVTHIFTFVILGVSLNLNNLYKEKKTCKTPPACGFVGGNQGRIICVEQHLNSYTLCPRSFRRHAEVQAVSSVVVE